MFGNNSTIQQQQQFLQQVQLQQQAAAGGGLGAQGSAVLQASMMQVQPTTSQQQFPFMFSQPSSQQLIQPFSTQNAAMGLLPSNQQQQLLQLQQQQQLLQQQQQQTQFNVDGTIQIPQNSSVFTNQQQQVNQQPGLSTQSSAPPPSSLTFTTPQTLGQMFNNGQFGQTQLSVDAMLLQQMNNSNNNNINLQQQQQYMMQAAGGYQLNLAQQYQLQLQLLQQQQIQQQQQQQQQQIQQQQQQQQQFMLLQAQNPLGYGYTLTPQQLTQIQLQNAVNNSNTNNQQAFNIQQQQQFAQLAALQQQQQQQVLQQQQLAALQQLQSQQQGQFMIPQQLQINQSNNSLINSNIISNNFLNNNILASIQGIPNNTNSSITAQNISKDLNIDNNLLSAAKSNNNDDCNNLNNKNTTNNLTTTNNNNSNSHEVTGIKSHNSHPTISLGSNSGGHANSLISETNNINNAVSGSQKNYSASTVASSSQKNQNESNRHPQTHNSSNQDLGSAGIPGLQSQKNSKNAFKSNNQQRNGTNYNQNNICRTSHNESEPVSNTFSGNNNNTNNLGGNTNRDSNESAFNELLKRKKITSEDISKKKKRTGSNLSSLESGESLEDKKQFNGVHAVNRQNSSKGEEYSSLLLKQSKKISKNDKFSPIKKQKGDSQYGGYNINSNSSLKRQGYNQGKYEGSKGLQRDEEISDEAKRRQSLRIMDKTKQYAYEEGNASNGSGSSSAGANERNQTRETNRTKQNPKKDASISSAAKPEPICTSCGFKISRNNFIQDKMLCRKCDAFQMKEKREQAAAIAAAKLAQPNTTTDFWALKLQKNKISIGHSYQAVIPPYQLHESSFRDHSKEYSEATQSRQNHFAMILANRVYQGTADSSKYESIYRQIREQQDRFTYSDLNILLQRYEFNLDDISEKLLNHDVDLIEIVKQQCNFKSNTRMTRLQMLKKIQV